MEIKKRKELKPLNLEILKNIFSKSSKKLDRFYEDIQKILKATTEKDTWEHLENNFVMGSVWKQSLGVVQHQNRMFVFEYLYVGSCGVAINWHSHKEEVNGKEDTDIKEWYIFPDGHYEFCDVNQQHMLINDADRPIYVISVKEKKARKESAAA